MSTMAAELAELALAPSTAPLSLLVHSEESSHQPQEKLFLPLAVDLHQSPKTSPLT